MKLRIFTRMRAMDFDGQVLCSVPDYMGGGSSKWPMNNVSVHAEGQLGAVNVADAVEQALGGWNRVCGINLALTANPRTANIVVTKGAIDGPAGTLAWSELPTGFAAGALRQLTQKYDTGELWTIADNPPAGKIDAVRVICHEIGHAIGISHIFPGNLMAPTYSTKIRWPVEGDIWEAQQRYKEAQAEPPTPTIGGGNADDPSIWEHVFPCLKGGAEIFMQLEPSERQAVLRVALGIWKRLSDAQRATLRELLFWSE